VKFDLRHGDSREVLRGLSEGSVDALVTDPPAGIGFMGKQWDTFGRSNPRAQDDREAAYDKIGKGASPFGYSGSGRANGDRDRFIAAIAPIFEECLRVLKPGAHGLVWALPRTSHWTATALEDAGFEIRDRVSHLFGTGFPKSLDVSKAIDKATTRHPETGEFVHRGTLAEMYPVTTEIADLRDVADVTNREIDALFGTNGMAGHWTARRTNSQPEIPSLDEWAAISGLFAGRFAGRIRDEVTLADAMRRLRLLDSEVARICGRKGKVGEAWLERRITGQYEQAAPGQTWRANYVEGASANEPSERRDEPNTDLARAWEGWGTALKPACEDWWLVRKPLDGTVAANVAAHGTGALNIDATRIGVSDADREALRNAGGWARPGYLADEQVYGGGKGLKGGKPTRETADYHPSGRWPANVTLSHNDDCERVGTKRVAGTQPRERTGSRERQSGFAMTDGGGGYADADGLETVEAWRCSPGCAAALLDEQSGESNGGVQRGGRGTGGIWSGLSNAPCGPQYGDSGGASRFFATFKSETTCPLCGSASGAGESSPRSDSDGDSAANRAAEASMPALGRDSQARTTNETPSGSSNGAASNTETMPLFGSAFSPDLQPGRLSQSDSPANDAGATEPTGITTTTASRSRSDGSAASATSPCTQRSAADGAVLPGSGTRFLYTPKPDRAERDIGCEDLAPASGGEATARADGTAGLQNPRAGAGRNGGSRNIHPTVKSVDLMRWLCRLITPKGGLVLDPFMGSGSTGVACSREGLRFIGIERERAYFEIARRRLVGDAPLLNHVALSLSDPEEAA
jgi:DNA modification methylase